MNGLGTDTVAAWGTFAKIDAIYWMVVNSFGIAITTFVGQNYGAGKIQRMRKSVKVCLLMSYGAAILVSAALYGFAEPLYRLFTTDSNVVLHWRRHDAFSSSVIFYVCSDRNIVRSAERRGKSIGTNAVDLRWGMPDQNCLDVWGISCLFRN